MKVKKILIVGTGPAGAASARKFAEAGFKVEAYDKRPHVAGNCFDELDDHGVLIHRYGPHYFRSNSLELLKWLSNFTKWIPGRYFVKILELLDSPTAPDLSGEHEKLFIFSEWCLMDDENFLFPLRASLIELLTKLWTSC